MKGDFVAGGRPTDYNEELVSEILVRMSSGESVVSICKDPRMPCVSTIINWKTRHPEFLSNYEQAKELCSEFYASEMLGIADDEDIPIASRNVRIRTRQWVSGRMRLKPRVEQEKVSEETHDDDFEAKKQELIDQIKEELGKD